MQFDYEIEIQPNVTESDPTRVITELCPGILKEVTIYFPWGCGGLAGVKILHYEHQLYPVNLDAWYRGNEILIRFNTNYQVLRGWKEFKVIGYNQDDTYKHTPIVGFVVLPFSTIPEYPELYI